MGSLNSPQKQRCREKKTTNCAGWFLCTRFFETSFPLVKISLNMNPQQTTSWKVVDLIICKVLYIPAGAGFLPSTVAMIYFNFHWTFTPAYLFCHNLSQWSPPPQKKKPNHASYHQKFEILVRILNFLLVFSTKNQLPQHQPINTWATKKTLLLSIILDG